MSQDQAVPYIGQEAAKESKFCPLAAVNKWPYKFFHHLDSETISQAFFAGGKFRTRGWTLYYIHTLLNNASKPLILIPASEVQALFDDIKKELRLLVYFPEEEKEPGFLLSFEEEGIPRPRYLGPLDLEHSLDDMEARIPPYTMEHRADDRSFAAFKKKMEAAIEATKQKSKGQRDRKKKERVGMKQGWCEQLKRAQCYLGVRPRTVPNMPNPMQDSSIPPRELERAMKRYQLSKAVELPELNVSEPAPFTFQDNVVFICVDVEAYEKDNRPITEIGISTLDTNDLVGLSPGDNGKDWMKKIRSRHFRIKETAHLHNSEYVAGCADRFEPEFGVSEWISFKEAPQVIASCFRPPYSRPAEHVNGDVSTILTKGTNVPKRQLILVGHDIKMDIDYLRKLGYDVSNLSNLIEALDTSDLYRAWKHQQNPTKLGTILMDMEMIGWNLHNAGNDAAYTLQALIGIVLASRQSSLATTQSQVASRNAAIEREARDRAKEEADEWAAADLEGGDGGPPNPLPRFGWPTSDEPKKGTTKNNAKPGKMLNSKDRRAEKMATETHAQSQVTKKIEAKQLQSPELKIESEPWVADDEEEVGASFAQSISERLAFLEEDGDTNEGGVRLPMVKGGTVAKCYVVEMGGDLQFNGFEEEAEEEEDERTKDG
ncbi:MAG: hypothetical protein Q9169_004910 [Polycauliona sp. 2 TL-2023]